MHTHTTQKQHLTENHSRYSSRIARKVSRAAQTKEARERNLAVVQLKQALPDKDLPLQKTIGNQEAHRLLQSGAIQAKLKIGAPNDKYEQEADQVADEVLRMPDNVVQTKPTLPKQYPTCRDVDLEKVRIRKKTISDLIKPSIQRKIDFDDCDRKGGTEEKNTIIVAHRKAIERLSIVVELLLNNTEAVFPFRGAFNPEGLFAPAYDLRKEEDMIDQAIKVLGKALAGLIEENFNYECDYKEDWNFRCEEGDLAWANTGALSSLYDIHICWGFFKQDRVEDQADTIIHEALHKWAGISHGPEPLNNAYAYESLIKRLSKRGMLIIQPQLLEEEEEKEKRIQRKEYSGQTPKVVPNLDSSIRSLKSNSRPMPASIRSYFEPRFGHDFSDVKIYSNSNANEMARSLKARAFTIGKNIVFGTNQYSPESDEGKKLLAHELAHVVQQSDPTEDVPVQVQRKTRLQEAEWLPELDEILPGRVGPITHIYRVKTLIDIFGTALLEEHVRLIRADAAASQFTRNQGVPGFVALYDTRRGNQLDVEAARQAITNLRSRYQGDSLNRLRLGPRAEAPPSYWFQDPASQLQGDGVEGEFPMTRGELRAQVFIESSLSKVWVGKNIVFVRFAYPEPEFTSRGVSSRVENAKRLILKAIKEVMENMTGLPLAASRQERREQRTVRAQLREVWRGLSRSSPLNVYIADITSQEFQQQEPPPPHTERIVVRLQDVGNPSQLKAAIRMPLMVLQGGRLVMQTVAPKS